MNAPKMLKDVLADGTEWTDLSDIALCQTEKHGGWLLVDTNWGTRHIVPVGDSIIHTVSRDDECICMPEIDTLDPRTGHEFAAVHSSLDGRELAE